MARRALIVVDVQHDFTDEPGAALPVSGGAALASRISEFLADHAHEYDAVVATRDWHVDPGRHFHDEPDYVDTWPEHCVADTPGAAFHPALDTSHVDAVFSKGSYSPSYTGFDGATDDGTPLAEWLHDRGIEEVVIVGIATDHCVRATALDAVGAGFGTTVLVDLTAGVAPQTVEAALGEMDAAGVALVGA